jgi:hypothetical protein
MVLASLHPARDEEGPFSWHQNAIEEMVQEGHTNNEIVTALTKQGLITSTRSLKRRLQLWNIRRSDGIRGKRISSVQFSILDSHVWSCVGGFPIRPLWEL